MEIKNTIQFIKEKAEQFGAKPESEFNKSYVFRKNIGEEALKDNGAFFGFIHPEEEASGAYHDFSFVIFPAENNKSVLSLCTGSNGFKNDYELSTFPGLRRLFSKLIDENGFCKSDFSDIETGLPKSITGNSDLTHLKDTIKKYTKVLPACQIIDDPESENGKEIITAFLAGYAKLRDWPTNKQHRDAVSKALQPFLEEQTTDVNSEIQHLVSERRFVVLQGPPGTGKTRTAKEIVKRLLAKTFFTQFHAETSFSDFIYGIRPDLQSDAIRYRENLGNFTQALKYAIENPTENTVLIIDEINRANLSNVLGPIFYLFEHKMEESDVEIEISPAFIITKLPENFYVIATMNTADRSLAVVDFALRRRFAWYAMRPQMIEGKKKKLDKITVTEIENTADYFFVEDFNVFDEIFDWYATSNELSLQPGQGYFMAASEGEMKNRIQYELFPLIKEYLQEGLLRNAKEELNTYFSNRIYQSLFE